MLFSASHGKRRRSGPINRCAVIDRPGHNSRPGAGVGPERDNAAWLCARFLSCRERTGGVYSKNCMGLCVRCGVLMVCVRVWDVSAFPTCGGRDKVVRFIIPRFAEVPRREGVCTEFFASISLAMGCFASWRAEVEPIEDASCCWAVPTSPWMISIHHRRCNVCRMVGI